jgi:hypothetical protein
LTGKKYWSGKQQFCVAVQKKDRNGSNQPCSSRKSEKVITVDDLLPGNDVVQVNPYYGAEKPEHEIIDDIEDSYTNSIQDNGSMAFTRFHDKNAHCLITLFWNDIEEYWKSISPPCWHMRVFPRSNNKGSPMSLRTRCSWQN